MSSRLPICAASAFVAHRGEGRGGRDPAVGERPLIGVEPTGHPLAVAQREGCHRRAGAGDLDASPASGRLAVTDDTSAGGRVRVRFDRRCGMRLELGLAQTLTSEAICEATAGGRVARSVYCAPFCAPF